MWVTWNPGEYNIYIYIYIYMYARLRPNKTPYVARVIEISTHSFAKKKDCRPEILVIPALAFKIYMYTVLWPGGYLPECFVTRRVSTRVYRKKHTHKHTNLETRDTESIPQSKYILGIYTACSGLEYNTPSMFTPLGISEGELDDRKGGYLIGQKTVTAWSGGQRRIGARGTK